MKAENGCGLCSVEIKNLTVKKGRDLLLDNISFDMHCGQLTALIGVNGAGKTTLLKSILGELRHSGSVKYASHNGDVIEKIKIGYVPQYLEFDRSSPMSVMDFLLAGRTSFPVWLGGRKSEKAGVLEALEKSGCKGLASRSLGMLSGGELQRVMLCQALYPVPELLILDEPVSGVDTVGSEQFYKQVADLRKDYHMAIVMVSHDLDLVRQYADKVLLLHRGGLIEGSVEEVFGSDEFRRAFGGIA